MNIAVPVDGVRLAFRPVQAGDADFLLRVYASTRADEMALVDWTDEQKNAFVSMQFNAQTTHYKTYYPTAEYFIIERAACPVGRLTLERSPAKLTMMDLALLPEYRNAGIGSTIIKNLMKEATETGVPLVLSVEFFNPALRLYTRLGFVKTRELNDVYSEMAWTPEIRPLAK